MAHAEVRRQCARQVEKSTPAAYDPVPLSTSICPSWTFCARPAARGADCQLPVPMSLSTFLHGVEASHLAGCRGRHSTMVKVDFMDGCVARMETVLYSSAGYFGRRPASHDDQEVRSAPSRLDALVVLHIPWHATSVEKERFFHFVVTVFQHPQCQTLSSLVS